MDASNIDINLVIQSFQEKISQLITELVVKEATIKQLNLQLQSLVGSSVKNNKKTKDTEKDDFS